MHATINGTTADMSIKTLWYNDAIRRNKTLVNFNSGNGLLHNGTKQLPVLILNNHQ